MVKRGERVQEFKVCEKEHIGRDEISITGCGYCNMVCDSGRSGREFMCDE